MQYFYNNMTRKYILCFAHLFSNIHVQRFDEDGLTLLSDSLVPLIYASKSKMFYEIKALPDSSDIAIISTYLPRMGFNISSMVYDSTRKMNNTMRISFGDEELSYPGVPYNFTIDLSILAKTQDDLFQIIEQISSNFTPDYTITIKEIENVIHRDVSLNLDSISFTSNFEYEDTGNRTVSADLNFTLKGYIYPKIQDDDGKYIKNIMVGYKFNDSDNDISVTVSQAQATVSAEIIKTITGSY